MTPTIVLVHGALTDASVWGAVTPRLQAEGYAVLAPALPLRGLASDAAYLAAFLATVDGPVVLAGHSYGGSVISHPATAEAKVKALVFVAAFQPDAGETAGELNGRFPGSLLGEATTVVRAYPGGQELYLKPSSFAAVYAGDVAPATAAAMAAAQRPIDPAALGEAFDAPPTWRRTPSWALISTRDRSLPPAALRFMADRAGSRAVEVESSHAAPVSHPDAVAALILDAARGVA